MNKCIICTFVKMVWRGLIDKTCPSIDKKKETSGTPPKTILKIIKEIVLGLFLAIPTYIIAFFIIYWIIQLMSILWFKYLIFLLIAIVLIVGAIGFYYVVAEFAKIRIECIKSYWQKAKEECE